MENKQGIAASYNNIGEIYVTQGDYKKGGEYYKKTIQIATEIGEKYILRSTYLSLSQLDSIIGDIPSAFKDYKVYILYRDSIDNEESRKNTIQSQMTFDFEKKEAIADAEHKKELQKQLLQLVLFFAIHPFF